MKFIKKPIVVEASPWFKAGDHPAVVGWDHYWGPPCANCGGDSKTHGCVRTLEGAHNVCPGDWIITGVAGEHYPCKPAIFKQTYASMDETNGPAKRIADLIAAGNALAEALETWEGASAQAALAAWRKLTTEDEDPAGRR